MKRGGGAGGQMEVLGMGESSLGVGGDVLGELGEFWRC